MRSTVFHSNEKDLAHKIKPLAIYILAVFTAASASIKMDCIYLCLCYQCSEGVGVPLFASDSIHISELWSVVINLNPLEYWRITPSI